MDIDAIYGTTIRGSYRFHGYNNYLITFSVADCHNKNYIPGIKTSRTLLKEDLERLGISYSEHPLGALFG